MLCVVRRSRSFSFLSGSERLLSGRSDEGGSVEGILTLLHLSEFRPTPTFSVGGQERWKEVASLWLYFIMLLYMEVTGQLLCEEKGFPVNG